MLILNSPEAPSARRVVGRRPWPWPGRAALPGEKERQKGPWVPNWNDRRGLTLAEGLRFSTPAPLTRALCSRRVGRAKHRKNLDYFVVKDVDDGDMSQGDRSLKGLPAAKCGET